MESLRSSYINKKTAAALATLALAGGLFSEESKAEVPSTQKTAEISKVPEYLKGMTIEGDKRCIEQTKSALKLLYNKAPKHSKIISNNIKIIQCVPEGSGVYANEAEPRFAVGDVERSQGIDWYAGVIVCDATHSWLYHDYKKKHPHKAVPREVWVGKESEAICLSAQANALEEIGAPSYQINYVNNVINTDYWDVPITKRYW